MKQPPLTDDPQVQRILEATPTALRRDVARSLRLLQLSNWVTGWLDARHLKPPENRKPEK